VSDFWGGKKVLVTGGAGMIGSHLVERLIDAGATIRVIDSLDRGCTANLHPKAELWPHRLGDQKLARWLVFPWQVDVVFHLAARVTGIGYNIKHDYQMMMDNLAINQEVAERVAKFRPGRFVFVSTSCIYPHDAPVPTLEHIGDVCNPEATNWGYGIAKWVGEQQAKALHKIGIPTAIVRFFNGCGPRDYRPGCSWIVGIWLRP